MRYLFPILILSSFALGWFLRGNPNEGATDPQSDRSHTELNRINDQQQEQNLPSANTTKLSPEEQLERFHEFRELKTLQGTIKALQVIDSMGVTELREAISSIGLRESRNPNDYFLPFQIMNAWVAIDPESAHAYCQSLTDPLQKSNLGMVLFLEWGQSDPEAALTAIEGIQNQEDRRSAKISLLHGLSMNNPQQAFDILTESPTSRDDWAYTSVFMNWAKNDVGGALAALESLKPGTTRNNARQGFSIALIQQDLPQSAAIASSLKDADDRKEVLSTVLGQWIVADIDAALDYLEQTPEGSLKTDLIANSIYSITKVSPATALAYTQQHLQGRQFDNAIQSIINELALSSPAEAIALIDNMPYGRAYEKSVNSLVKEWSKSAPIEALEWASALPPSDERNDAVRHAIDALTSNSIDAAKNRILSLADGQEKTLLIKSISSHLARDEPQVALDWVHSLEPSDASASALNKVLSTWAFKDPSALVDYLDTQSVELQREHSKNIAQSWARKDPSAASTWAVQIEDEDASRAAINQVSWEWLEHDTYAATVWISELENGTSRDMAVTNLVRKVTTSEPEAAFKWSATIRTEKIRQRESKRVIQRWQSEDPEAARAAIKASDLTDTEKEALFKELPTS
ncbi:MULTISPECIES: hypothetical protein [unclassified Lentimonas]|uniref:hypothetical protein n=1 Tax=unclassified Lentimonas TaxID=2630993 RepID=UPI00132B1DB4|nr:MULTISPECIES: hypothetical protein [unclassified Lentimonas]CAA6689875.1 DNA repair protein RadA [Lentimonas sp. CC10]CAA6697154.1 DNA repair protein RadA [Lentimonas sp. CC19]CAA7069428.1 DNA repair protein RadA [Lentimonas sp. CC11]